MLSWRKKRQQVEQAKLANSKVKDHTDYKEDETRKLKSIFLKKLGWEIGVMAREEIPVTACQTHQVKAQSIMYCMMPMAPLALVEAKRTSVNPEVGQQQAKLYADCLEQQTGQRPVIFIPMVIAPVSGNDVQGDLVWCIAFTR